MGRNDERRRGMIKEIDVAELVTYMAEQSGKEEITVDYTFLRSVGNYLEEKDHSIRVSLSDSSYYSFQICSMRHITIVDNDELTVRGISSPVIQTLIKQYAPKGRTAKLIDEALKKYRK